MIGSGAVRFAVGEASVAEMNSDQYPAGHVPRHAPGAAGAGRAARHRADQRRSGDPELGCRAETIVGGDAVSYSIAAASIFAKVTRDRYMLQLAAAFPGYGWETNRGYGSREHLAALRRLGPTPHHRTSFAPVRARYGEPVEAD